MSTIINTIIQEHVQLAAFLWAQRSMLSSAHPVDAALIEETTGRIAAHLDAIEIAGQNAWPFIEAQYSDFQEAGELFVFGYLAIATDDQDRINTCFEYARTTPENLYGLAGAFAWFAPDQVSNHVREMIAGNDDIRRAVATEVLVHHAADPKGLMTNLLVDTSPLVRCAAFRLVTATKRMDCVDAIKKQITSDDPDIRYGAAIALAHLNEPQAAKPALEVEVLTQSDKSSDALRTLAAVLPQKEFISFLTELHDSEKTRPSAIRGLGMTGERGYLKWLIKQMDDPHLSAAAGESFLELYPEAEGTDGLFSDDPEILGDTLWKVADAAVISLPVAVNIAAWAKAAQTPA